MKLLCAALVLLAAFPATASASWTGSMRVPGSAGAMWPAAAVNGRGDVAVAWIEEGRRGGRATLRVRAAIRPAWASGFSVRTLVARRGSAARGTAVALDARGELTVAWIEQASDNGRLHGPKTVRAAYRGSGGRWSPVRAIGRSSAFNYATPRLLARPDRSVVLTYNAARSVAAAWRSPGRAFGAVRSVPVDRFVDPTLAADRSGRVFLTGTRGCTGSSAAVRVAVAAPGSRRFTATTVSTAAGKDVRLAVMGRGAAAVAWLGGRCSTSEATAGAPFASTLVNGVASTPTALGTTSAATLVASPAPGGGADVSFGTTELATARVTRQGVGAPAAAPDGWIPLRGTSAGDQLIARPSLVNAIRTPLAARTAAGSDPAPVAAIGYPWTAGTVASQNGRALAALSFRPLSSSTPSIVLAVWRP